MGPQALRFGATAAVAILVHGAFVGLLVDRFQPHEDTALVDFMREFERTTA